jgi:hypothetical protein
LHSLDPTLEHELHSLPQLKTRICSIFA